MATHTPMTGNIGIYCSGDSETLGTVSSGPAPSNAYRKALSDALQADLVSGAIPNTVSFTFQGPLNNGDAPSNNHDGRAGITSENAFPLQLTDTLAVTTSQLVVITYIGINDAQQNPPSAFPNGFLSLIRRQHNLFRALNPRFIFGILNGAWNPSLVAPLNAQLPALIAELNREGIESETVTWDWMGDHGGNSHPTQVEYDLLGGGSTVGQSYHVAFRALIGYPM